MEISESAVLKQVYDDVIDQLLVWEDVDNWLEEEKKQFPKATQQKLIERFRYYNNLDITVDDLIRGLLEQFDKKLLEMQEIRRKYFEIEDELKLFEKKKAENFEQDIKTHLADGADKVLRHLNAIS